MFTLPAMRTYRSLSTKLGQPYRLNSVSCAVETLVTFSTSMRFRGATAGLLAAVLYGVFSGTVCAVTVDDFAARRYTNSQGVLPYRLFIPTNYDSAAKYPLVLFMHGSGESGTDNRKQLVGQTGPLVFASATNQAKYPSFMVAPQCPVGGAWTDSTRRTQVLELMNALQQEFSIDPDRLYITGLSLGGYGTWDYIAQYPNMYAAAIPMSGGGNISLASRMTRIAIWNFHAANDGTVPVSGSRTTIDAVRKAGGNPIYTEYASGGHVVWTPAYNTPILMDWVYAQARGTAPTVPPLLSINVPTGQPIYASAAAALDLGGTASDGSTGPTSVTWTNYRTQTIAASGSALGTTGWTITNLTLFPTDTNVIVVTGKGTSWSSSLGGTTTFNDTLTVIFPPFINSQPASQAVNKDDGVMLSVGVNPVAPSPRYQWRLNGTNVSGATNSTFTLTSPQRTDSGYYSVEVSNVFGTAISADARLRVLVSQRLLVPIVQADGSLLLTSGDSDGGSLTEADAAFFQVWASTNLVNWELLPAGLTVSNGMLWACDGMATDLPQRFYRFAEKAVWRIPVPQRLEPPLRQTDGTVALSFGDSDGGRLTLADLSQFEVWASTNLVDWQILNSTLALTNGRVRLTDTATNYLWRFYRVVEK